MKSEFTIRLADLDLPLSKGEPRSGAAFRKKVVEALERTYQGLAESASWKYRSPRKRCLSPLLVTTGSIP